MGFAPFIFQQPLKFGFMITFDRVVQLMPLTYLCDSLFIYYK